MLQYAIIFALAVGFACYIAIAKRNPAITIEQFFLGGRNINGSLFQNTTWGTSFAFNNGIYWGVYFGYTCGFNSLWINGSWAAGFVALSLILPRLIVPTGKFTLHGYLGDRYDGKVRVMASIASSTVMVFNIGAEIYFASIFIAYFLNVSFATVAIVVMIALFSASFCGVGGFKANAAIDTYQNPLSVLGLLTIICLCAISASSVENNWSIILLGTISVAFLGGFALFGIGMPTRFYRYEAACLTICALIAAMILMIVLKAGPTGSPTLKDILFSRGPNTNLYLISVILFQFLYQFVDTGNWQNISARRITLVAPGGGAASRSSEFLQESEVSSARMAMGLRLAAYKIFLAPIFLTTIIGIAFRFISPNNESSDANFMISVLNTITGQLPTWIHVPILAILSFILLGSSRSGIDSWVMAASQTLSWDIVDHAALKESGFNVGQLTKGQETRIVSRAKASLFLLTLVGALAYYILYSIAAGQIVLAFSVIFSSSLSLLPSLMYGLFGNANSSHELKLFSLLSIATGYAIPLLLVVGLALLGPLNFAGIEISKDDMFTFAPFIALGLSGTILLCGVAVSRFARYNGKI